MVIKYLELQRKDGKFVSDGRINPRLGFHLTFFKNSEPLLLAEYVKIMSIATEPAFNWWVPHTLGSKRCLLSKRKKLYHKSNIKLGLEVPCSIAHAQQIDKANANNFWCDVILKGRTNVKIAFKFLDKDQSTPVGYTRINYHIIFDVKNGSY